ncbi:MAG: DUF3106 domain-containing protein [Planctomycetes bacterium]|nr:DUF3106 domain-containing protein [Planctomycetota bacterium]
MKRACLLVLAFAMAVAAQSSTVDPAKLERIRKMSPEERKKLLERLERFKKMSPEERDRLRENLNKFRTLPPEVQKKVHEQSKNLTEEERKGYKDLASGLFREMARKQPPREVQAFPRMAFFLWIKNTRPAEVDRLKKLGPEERTQALLILAREFRGVVENKVLDHARKHKCVGVKEVEGLKGMPSGEFWVRWRDLMKQCAAKNANRQFQKAR